MDEGIVSFKNRMPFIKHTILSHSVCIYDKRWEESLSVLAEIAAKEVVDLERKLDRLETNALEEPSPDFKEARWFALQPFEAITLPFSPDFGVRVAAMWARFFTATARQDPVRRGDRWDSPRQETRQLRVAMIASNWGSHPVIFGLEGLFQYLGRSSGAIANSVQNRSGCSDSIRWYGMGTSKQENFGAEFRAPCVEWRQTEPLKTAKARSRVRSAIDDLRIDVLVDLYGWTAGGDLMLFANRAAPLQVGKSWFGPFALECYFYVVDKLFFFLSHPFPLFFASVSASFFAQCILM